MTDTPTITLVIPAFNEETCIPVLFESIKQELAGENFVCLFVDDGSTDGTLEVLKNLRATDSRVQYISFSRNFGHQFALKAGLDHATGDCVITMDADMQHPPMLIKELLKKWREGYAIVQTVREEDYGAGAWKQASSNMFYSLLNKLSRTEVRQGAADFRLMDSSVVDCCKELKEHAYFWRGIVPWTGFQIAYLSYKPEKRFSGVSKYSFAKMVKLATDGIFSFSLLPLRISLFLGAMSIMVGIIYFLYALGVFLTGNSINGWASLICVILFFSGVQLLSLGIIGEYVGRTFMALKNRPDYIVKATSLTSPPRY